MLKEREKRPAPPVDRAIMTDRNALMISGYLLASDATHTEAPRTIALAALDFVLANLRDPDGGYFHVWSGGHASVPGIAADQVYLMNALLDAYQASADKRYLEGARLLADVIATTYRDGSGLIVNRSRPAIGGVASASGGSQVLYDQPTPSVQASAATRCACSAN